MQVAQRISVVGQVGEQSYRYSLPPHSLEDLGSAHAIVTVFKLGEVFDFALLPFPRLIAGNGLRASFGRAPSL